MAMSEVLVHVGRGPIVESLHSGHVAVVNAQGRLLYYAGNPYRVSYLRSSAKPLQAMNFYLSGAAKKFNFSEKGKAIMCASHYGEEFHHEVVLENLAAMGLSYDDLRCSIQYSINPAVAEKQMRSGQEPSMLNCDCSGKHTGFLASCLASGYPIENYDVMENPVQQDMLKILAEMFEVPAEDIPIGEDGCGVPVHAVPVFNMALAFAKITNPEGLTPEYRDAANQICEAMNAHPEMVSGTNGFCTELMRHTHGKFIGKAGADGVYCLGVRGGNLGIAVKIEDGNDSRVVPAATMRALMDLGLLTEEEQEALAQFISRPNMNGHGRKVGDIYPVYHLHKTL